MRCWRLTEKDIPAMENAVGQIERAYLPDHIEAFLRKESNYIFAVADDDMITGYAYGYALERFDGIKPMLFIFSVDIRQQFQNMKYGTKLLSFIVEYAKANGFSECFVITERSNPRACRVYENAGFVAEHGDDVVYVANLGEKSSSAQYSVCEKRRSKGSF